MDGLIETLGQLARSVDEVTAAVHEGQDEASRERAQFAARLEHVRRQVRTIRAQQQTHGAEIAGLSNRVLILEDHMKEREEWSEIRAWIQDQRRPWWERLILWWRR